MKKKKILYLLNKKFHTFRSNRQHTNWVYDCMPNMSIRFWGKNISQELSMLSLKKVVDVFKPDYIYATIRRRYEDWLPDITSIKVPKIFVEMDTWHYSPKDPWYNQFDILKCRCPWWNGWDEVPFFQWSVPEKSFPIEKISRNGIYFIGEWEKGTYTVRREMHKRFKDKIQFCRVEGRNYWDSLHKAGALICPTESGYGDFIPSKLFEYASSGAAVITNCNLKRAGLTGIQSKIINYTDLDSIEAILDMDFEQYHGKAIRVMRKNTHAKRYKELFK